MVKAGRFAPEEQRALTAIEHHHHEMTTQLRALVSALVEAAAKGDSAREHDAHGSLVEWCERELIPHAQAEEGPLYSGARNLPEGGLLVQGMLAEHRAIIGLVDKLRAASSPVEAAAAAFAIKTVFSLHFDKENQLLLPLIAASDRMSLAEAVEGLEELVGDVQTHSSPRHETHSGGSP